MACSTPSKLMLVWSSSYIGLSRPPTAAATSSCGETGAAEGKEGLVTELGAALASIATLEPPAVLVEDGGRMYGLSFSGGLMRTYMAAPNRANRARKPNTAAVISPPDKSPEEEEGKSRKPAVINDKQVLSGVIDK